MHDATCCFSYNDRIQPILLQGMLYLQDSALRYHGALSTSNCLIDSRWVVKLSDFGLQAFKQGVEETNDIQTMNAKCLSNLNCNRTA